MPNQDPRYRRFVDRGEDYRAPGERDLDRILYSSAFRRLAGVTQVVAASETQLFHNRLTHSLKVAQIAQRLAESLVSKYDAETLARAGGLDPSIAEAAGLAHDLGHPPFGHIAEAELQHVLKDILPDSFEGNAQSFRILTKLAWRTPRPEEEALNLTRASLNAVLKYPWVFGEGPEDSPNDKWGAYFAERPEFDFARGDTDVEHPSLEAAIMDWADDIAYAVHDVEDFFRAGAIPLDRLQSGTREPSRFTTYASAKLGRKHGKKYDPQVAATAFEDVRQFFPTSPYHGMRADEEGLHQFGSTLIELYFGAATITPDGKFHIADGPHHQVGMLKELTWYYVLDSPSLATMQRGQRRMVRELFSELTDLAGAAEKDRLEQRRLPTRLGELLRAIRNDTNALAAYDGDDNLLRARAVVDYISLLTEQQAVELHRRLIGPSDASALEGWLQT